MTLPFIRPAPTAGAAAATSGPLSLDEIRERLLQLKEPERMKAA
jgi:hypothetical protein